MSSKLVVNLWSARRCRHSDAVVVVVVVVVVV